MAHLLLVDCLPAVYLLVVSLSADYLRLVAPAAGTLTADCLPDERLALLEALTVKMAVACSLPLMRHLILGPTQ